MLVVDSVMNGFNLHRLENGACLRNFPLPSREMYSPNQVALVENLKVVVGGSDHGIVYVFDRETGTAIDTLRHPTGGMVQTVTVSLLLG